MTFQNPILNFEQTEGWTDKPKAICLSLGHKNNMPPQLFQSWGLSNAKV